MEEVEEPMAEFEAEGEREYEEDKSLDSEQLDQLVNADDNQAFNQEK